MPLFWAVSSFILFVIMLVMVLLYSYSYFTVNSLFFSSGKSSYFWCW